MVKNVMAKSIHHSMRSLVNSSRDYPRNSDFMSERARQRQNCQPFGVVFGHFLNWLSSEGEAPPYLSHPSYGGMGKGSVCNEAAEITR
jgi:hypothetical protein